MSLVQDGAGVTVGIPFYAGVKPQELRRAVDSVLMQTLPPHEIHLIQDGPVPPALSELVEGYLRSHQAVRLIEIPINQGLAHALNASIIRTTTEFYARMDADDICFLERLEKQVAFLTEHQDVEVVGAWAYEFTNEDELGKGFLKRLPTTSDEMRCMFHYRDPFIHPVVMFRRSLFSRIGLYNTQFRTDQDTELWGRVFRSGVKVANLGEPLLYFRSTGVVKKRSSLPSVLRQARVRFSFPTLSPKLNLLKVASIAFRLTPYWLREWGYRTLR